MSTLIYIEPRDNPEYFFRQLIHDINTNFSGLTSGGTTTGVSNNISKSVLIPANTFRANDVIEMDAVGVKVGTSGTLTMRFYVAPTNSLTAATVLGVFTNVAGNLTTKLYRKLRVKSSSTTEAINTAALLANDFNVSTTARSLVSIDWTQPQYLIAATQNSAAADASMISTFSIIKF